MSFNRFLRPKSIALIGGREAEVVAIQCLKAGYKGNIWPVHPTKTEVAGLPVYPSIADLPSSPDAAFVAVNRVLSVEMIRQLESIKAGGTVCYATGFSEADELGAQLEKDLLAVSGDMPLLGPNCYGVLNYIDGATLWPDQHGGEHVESGVAIITQSSNIAINFSMQRRGLPIAYIASLGNKIKFDIHDAIIEMSMQDNVTAIGLYLEGLEDPTAFEAAVKFARDKNKAVVVMKSGVSDQAKQMNMSHTASISGADSLIDALLARCGAARVKTMEGLIEALKYLHINPPLTGVKIGSMSPSGGDAALIADAIDQTKLMMPALTSVEVASIKNTVNELVTVMNPFDYQVFDWFNEAKLTETFRTFIESDFDLSLCVFDYPRDDQCDISGWNAAENAIISAQNSANKPVVVLSIMPETLPEFKVKKYLEHGIVAMSGLSATIEALNAVATIGESWNKELGSPLLRQTPTNESTSNILTEVESKREIARYGIEVPKGVTYTSGNDLTETIKSLSYPLVVKGLGVAHKTEADAVKLNLSNIAEVESAIDKMKHVASEFLIEEMAQGIIGELIIGVAKDPQFGAYLVVGTGGVLVELYKDTASLLIPFTAEQAKSAILNLKMSPLLTGYRGSAPGDIDAAVNAVLSVGRYVADNIENIVELDLNPLLIRKEGQGVVAADALIGFSS